MSVSNNRGNMREETAIENTNSESAYVLEENGALSLEKCLD